MPQLTTVMEKLKSIDLTFVERFRQSIYVDNFTARSYDVESAFEFHLKFIGYTWLKPALTLRNLDTNSPELHRRISDSEQMSDQGNDQAFPDAAVVYFAR